MKRKSIRIDELRVRAAGLSENEARQLGNAVARQLAAVELNPDQRKSLGVLNVSIRSRRGSVEQLAKEIAEGVRRRLS